MNTIVIYYLLIINILSFLIYGLDKWKAQRKLWRIPESVLFILAVIGGNIGAIAGMSLWHHKTQHRKFKFGIPLIFLIQIAVVVAFLMES